MAGDCCVFRFPRRSVDGPYPEGLGLGSIFRGCLSGRCALESTIMCPPWNTFVKYLEQITLIHLYFANMGLNDEMETGRDKKQTREKNRDVNIATALYFVGDLLTSGA